MTPATAVVGQKITTIEGLAQAGALTAVQKAWIEHDVPRLVDFYRAGELKLDEVVSHRLRLDELGLGLERLRAGTAMRQLIVFD